MTVYLKFPDEQAAIAAMPQYRGTDEDGGQFWLTASHAHALDPVGIIHAPTGLTLTDDEGMEYPETAPIEGWHCNLIGPVPVDAEPYIVEPSTPSRVFA